MQDGNPTDSSPGRAPCADAGIHLNGKPLRLSSDRTVAALLRELGIQGRIAVELNREILPRSQFGRRTLCPGDRIEIVHAVGGG